MAYKKEPKCLASKQKLGTPFSQTERQAEATVPFLNPPPREPQSQQAGAISETPSTWLIPFGPPWISTDTLPHPNYRCPKLLFHMNGWHWLLLHNFLNPIKQATAGLRKPQARHSSSQPRFTAWLCLGISKPSTSQITLYLRQGGLGQNTGRG